MLPLGGPGDSIQGEIYGEIEDLQGRFNINNLVDAQGEVDQPSLEQFQRLLLALGLDPRFAGIAADLDHELVEESVVEQVDQRLKHLAGVDQPARQLRPRQGQAGSGRDLFLAVQWQAIEVLADHHVCQQRGTRPTAGQRLGRHGRGADALLTGTGIGRADVPDHVVLLRNDRELFKHLLADTLQWLAAVAMSLAGIVDAIAWDA